MAQDGDGADWRLAVAAVTTLVGMMVALVVLVMRMTGDTEEKPEATRGAGGRRRGALDRMQRGAARAAEGGDDDDEDDEDEANTGSRGGRRQAVKDEKKQEKKAQQQAARDATQERNQSVVDKHSKYKQKQQDKEQERLLKEEEEKKAREEKEKNEQEDFDKWKDMFNVDAEGQDDAANAGESAVEQFIEYIKVRKVVQLEDLAAEFKLKTSAAIERLRELEKLGRLSGIFDDRGKYVYITAEEMAGVATWLKKRGRINRPDLVANCNKIVRLNPTAEDKAKLQREAQSAATALDDDAQGGEAEAAAAA